MLQKIVVIGQSPVRPMTARLSSLAMFAFAMASWLLTAQAQPIFVPDEPPVRG